MEEEKNKIIKKEIPGLFCNFKLNNKEAPISTHINIRKHKINNYINDINDYYEKIALTENDSSQRDSYGYYRHIFTKYFSSQLNEPTKKKKPKKKPKHFFQLYSKIHFGSFFNNSLYLENDKNIDKYEIIKSKFSKTKNFSFIKDPKTQKYNKLPLDLYLSKEDSLKIKDLISVKLLPNKNKDNTKKESLIKFSYDNGIFDNSIFNYQKSINKFNNRKIFYINKNKISENQHIENNKHTSEENLKISNNLNSEKENKESPKKSTKTKYNIHKNLSDLSNNIHTNINPKNILVHQKNYNQTEYKNLYQTKKNLLLSLNQKIKNFKTPKKALKEFVKISKHDDVKKRNKIKKLINKANLKADPKLIVNDLKNNDHKITKKNLTKQIYLEIKKRGRLLSIVDNLHNIKRNAPLKFLNRVYEEYDQKSKEIIKIDSTRKKINQIYKSSDEGKLIKKKIDEKNYAINKIITKNKMEGIKLKNKYEKFDLIIDRINEEQKVNPMNLNNETDY